MTRPTWTTPEQKEWLDPRKAAFIEAKQKGNAALKEWYLAIFKEFREKWPVPAVTESETTAAGSVELATRLNAINMIRCVVVTYFIKYNLKGLTHSGCENGFTTTPEISLRTGALEVCSRLSPSQEYFRGGKPTRR